MTKIACIQMNSGDDLAANLAEAERFVRNAAGQGAKLVALPENAFFMRRIDGGDTERGPAQAFPAEAHPGLRLCRALAAELGIALLAGSVFTLAEGGKWHNDSRLYTPEGEAAAYDKIHLFDVSLAGGETYRESDRVAPGDRLALADLGWAKLGMSVCYDLRFPHLYRDLAKRGADILAVPSAFAETTGKAHWHILLRARAIENGCFVIAPAQGGAHPGGRRTYGHSLIVGPWGEILAEADGETPGVLIADIDLSDVAKTRSALPCLTHDRPYA